MWLIQVLMVGGKKWYLDTKDTADDGGWMYVLRESPWEVKSLKFRDRGEAIDEARYYEQMMNHGRDNEGMFNSRLIAYVEHFYC